MAQVRCQNAHYYDDAKHSSCPICGVVIPNIGPTEGAAPAGGASPGVGTSPGVGASPGATVGAGGGRPGTDSPTVAEPIARFGGIDPVVGWLVCIAGPDKGRDLRIHAERNHLGRDPGMDIVIPGDESVSRLHHAVVSYNPERHRFSIAPGTARGITYVNGEELLNAQPLESYDEIRVGRTKLLFVPFCGERFHWPLADEGT